MKILDLVLPATILIKYACKRKWRKAIFDDISPAFSAANGAIGAGR